MIIYESRQNTWVIDQAKMLICKLVTKLQIMTLASTYILYYYLSYGYNFEERNRSVQRSQKEK